MKNRGSIVGVNKNMITVAFEGNVMQNEVAYAVVGESRLKAEVIRVRGNRADLQVFEDTRGFQKGDIVEFTGELLSVELGPGLLGQLYDGLQNPLHALARELGFFLHRGKHLTALPDDIIWEFTPCVNVGDTVEASDAVGTVKEGILTHKILVPFSLSGKFEVVEISGSGKCGVREQIARIKDTKGKVIPLCMMFEWPVKRPLTIYRERLDLTEPLLTRVRIIDTLFPVAKGGAYCVPGPFGAGKTVLQQIISRNARVDIVIIAACGERAGEVVETIKEFPKIIDPFTGKSLMERTIIVCNTSSMPVAAREASVYTAITMAEYYRQMGLDVLLLADSTSRWAQALRERSSRLEEIPGEEAFPAYLESTIAGFYERAGRIRLKGGDIGSITIGGTVSPAGGNFEEPVTQATLKVVGAFHGLSRERSDARCYPAIDPFDSWSKYHGFIETRERGRAISLLSRAHEIDQMMKVVGEEGILLEDYILYLKGAFFDNVYLQQNAFDPVDGATSEERQRQVFGIVKEIMDAHFTITSKEEARSFFNKIRQLFLEYNGSEWHSHQFIESEKLIREMFSKQSKGSTALETPPFREALVESDIDSHFSRSKIAKSKIGERFSMVKEENEKDIQQDPADLG
ncbi:MAG: V-type ATP synthase subunit A [Candidatus Scalindua sp. AMX11]|nr:MAG: V-type ATP synthase subunit A [Candidatus Scalindua sp.]NOG83082.1 V-type ATP synthase subunit A [Planctomycetota bacterium]RZV63116.1 MAG: V-type ATP synthase subunit A [Candidatus Scalindua sp. SCAELEC01]TDE63354.1 MAG: V-type ATP synthase subunit A [Candidatus Scalindua sp. AMX11]GJQ57375.1 MAG: V-type ATP synthase alpha chain [Candidatus Scalindua sp.]